jgi:threonine aldolase
MPLSIEQRALLKKNCSVQLHGFADAAPADQLQELARWSAVQQIEHDSYGEGKLVTALEQRIAELLGKPAAAFMPSGVMAQLIALKLHTEQHRLNRFGLHHTSHLIGHEEQAYAALFGTHGVLVGDANRPIVADDVKKIKEPLACLFVELPMREIGGQLPSWQELEQLKSETRERGMALHMDGARLWESRAYYARSYAEIADGFDSVYVSLYKGIGAIAGAALGGSEEFIANAKLWRRRMGGTIFRQGPLIASALMRLDERLAQMEALYQRTLLLAEGLNSIGGLRTLPRVPQCNMLHLLFDAPVEAVLDARDRIAEEQGIWMIGYAKATDHPGRSRTEFYVGDQLLGQPTQRVIALFQQLLSLAQAAP